MPRRVLSLLSVLLALGCPTVSLEPDPIPPTLDASLLPDALLGEPYAGRLRLRPSQPATWSLVDGALPDGLSLLSDGRVAGTPVWLGAFVASIRADTAGLPAEGSIAIVVGPGAAPVAPGFARAPFATPQGVDLLVDPWVRVAGGGEEGMTVWVLDPGWYLPGPDGLPEAGAGDDVQVGDVDPGDAELGVGQWIPSDEVAPSPPLDPSGHANEGSPPTVDRDALTLTAGADTGRLALTLVVAGFEPLATRLAVVPPDWCPRGEHPRGGPTEGVCE